jgi:hypothetical protein
MATNALAAEQGREPETFRNHLLGDAHVVFRFRLADNKFSDL